MPIETQEFMTEQHLGVIREKARSIRRQYLKYKDAEVVYSLTHRKLLEMADEAGAINGSLFDGARKNRGLSQRVWGIL